MGAARGAGVMPSSSTTASTSAAGKAMRRPARRTISSSSAIGSRPFAAPRLERAEQGGAVVAIDAVVARRRLRARRGGARPRPASPLGGVARPRAAMTTSAATPLAGRDDAIAEALDQRPQHIVHPGIAGGQRADGPVGRRRRVVGMSGEQPVGIEQLDLRAVDQGDAGDLARRRRAAAASSASERMSITSAKP